MPIFPRTADFFTAGIDDTFIAGFIGLYHVIAASRTESALCCTAVISRVVIFIAQVAVFTGIDVTIAAIGRFRAVCLAMAISTIAAYRLAGAIDQHRIFIRIQRSFVAFFITILDAVAAESGVFAIKTIGLTFGFIPPIRW